MGGRAATLARPPRKGKRASAIEPHRQQSQRAPRAWPSAGGSVTFVASPWDRATGQPRASGPPDSTSTRCSRIARSSPAPSPRSPSKISIACSKLDETLFVEHKSDLTADRSYSLMTAPAPIGDLSTRKTFNKAFLTNSTRCELGSHLRLSCIRADGLQRPWVREKNHRLCLSPDAFLSLSPNVRNLPRHVSYGRRRLGDRASESQF